MTERAASVHSQRAWLGYLRVLLFFRFCGLYWMWRGWKVEATLYRRQVLCRHSNVHIYAHKTQKSNIIRHQWAEKSPQPRSERSSRFRRPYLWRQSVPASPLFVVQMWKHAERSGWKTSAPWTWSRRCGVDPFKTLKAISEILRSVLKATGQWSHVLPLSGSS